MTDIDEEMCPICLTGVNNENYCILPVCSHKVHVKCMMEASQYDVRCPICRQTDPNIAVRNYENNEESEIMTRLHTVANEQHRIQRSYTGKRNRFIRKKPKLLKLRQEIKNNRKILKESELTLEKKWSEVQRNTWKSNQDIKMLHAERTKHLRKLNRLCKKFEDEIEAEVGPAPPIPQISIDDLIF